MLEHVPKVVGRALQGARAGLDKIVSRSADFAGVPETLTLTSSAFTDGNPLPARFTEDGAKISPPLAWHGVPPNAAGLVLVAEDPDAPLPEPIVHVLAWQLPPRDGALDEGALASPGSPGSGTPLGKNSFLKAQYLPPDPPTGHGPHSYVFQLFALDRPLVLDPEPGRSTIVAAMTGHVIAKGLLTGTYERR